MDKLIDVTRVEVIGDHQLRLTFEDGLVGDIDFTGRDWRRVFEPLADQAFFAQVRVDPEIGTVVWPNGVDPGRALRSGVRAQVLERERPAGDSCIMEATCLTANSNNEKDGSVGEKLRGLV
jgi:hypothetical protein